MEIPFGTSDIEKIINQIGKNKDFGTEIGKGGLTIAQSLGSPDKFMGVKGAAIASFEPRALWGFGLHIATSNCGAYHLNGSIAFEELLGIHQMVKPFSIEDKPKFVRQKQDEAALLDALGFCLYILFALKLNNILPFYRFSLNTEVNLEELVLIGERIYNLERLFNLKAGIDNSYDSLPKRFREEALNGYICPLEEMLPHYYQQRGWDSEGRPTKESKRRLGLTIQDAENKNRP
jgi:aldehyde:ferredoxin oxidoreductase